MWLRLSVGVYTPLPCRIDLRRNALDAAPQPALGCFVDRHQHLDQRLIYERFQDLCSSLIPRQPRRIVELQPHRIIRRILRDRDPLHLTEEKIAISARATYQGPHNSSEEETHLRQPGLLGTPACEEQLRSEERGVGKECGSTCRARGAPEHK